MVITTRPTVIPGERRYSKALARIWNPIERTFGMLMAKFPCLAWGIIVKSVRGANAIIAAVALHIKAVSAREVEQNDNKAQEDEMESEMEPGVRENHQEPRFRTAIFRTRASGLLYQSCLCSSFAYRHCALAS